MSAWPSPCIEAVCREIAGGRRKILVEMTTGTGKTSTAAALLKHLFEANWVTHALFVVDRNTPTIQADDAFAEYLLHLLWHYIFYAAIWHTLSLPLTHD